jgi:hypothetical protein
MDFRSPAALTIPEDTAPGQQTLRVILVRGDHRPQGGVVGWENSESEIFVSAP